MCEGCATFHTGNPQGTFQSTIHSPDLKAMPVEAHFCEPCADDLKVQFRLVAVEDPFADEAVPA
jgi:hypothetical protein